MIGIRVYGGLGNQMFQYAFYQYLRITNKEIGLDISDFKIHQHHYGFELDNAFSNLQFDVLPEKSLKKLRIDPNLLINRCLNKMFGLRISRKNEIREYPASLIVNNVKYKDDIYFHGYWANTYYVKEVERVLREHFKFRYILDGKNKELYERCKSYPSASVHIRRGDFLQNSSIANCCSIEYYKQAFEIIKQNYKECLFVVFSDDIEWTRKNINFSDNIIYVNWNNGTYSFVDMQMMSLCDHNIIANSTFSWWGAWLNSNPKKIVISPTIWNLNDDTKSSMNQDGWITI